MIKSLVSAFLMYSKIPMPQIEWKEENRRYSLGFFPLVGAVEGTLLCLWRVFCNFTGAGQLIFSAVSVLIPVMVTGGIHIDGFCDVTDAVSSYGDKDKRLKIMSDSHVGAFAVMHLCLYFLLQTALFSEVHEVKQTVFISLGYVLSRALSGLSAVLFRSAKKDGALQDFVRPSDKKVTIAMEILFLLVSVFTITFIYPLTGILCTVASFGVLFFCRRTAYRDFGGITGDVCGWFLQICEIFFLGVFVICKLLKVII